jgi:hypothetical protein
MLRKRYPIEDLSLPTSLFEELSSYGHIPACLLALAGSEDYYRRVLERDHGVNYDEVLDQIKAKLPENLFYQFKSAAPARALAAEMEL